MNAKVIVNALLFLPNLLCAENSSCSVPKTVMNAIAMIESGYKGKPYRFLIGLNGQQIESGRSVLKNFNGKWLEHRSFDCLNEENCINAANALIQNGIYNVDFGKYQINHYWHYRFANSLSDYFAEEASHKIACKIVESCIERNDYTWEGIACYHSSTFSKNRKYAKKLYEEIAPQ